MVIIRRFFSAVMSIFLMCNFTVNTAALTDLTHSYYEESKLFETTWYKATCLNDSPTCQKHILRFESVKELIDFLEKQLRITRFDKNFVHLKRYLGAGAVIVTGVAAIKLILIWKIILALGGVGLGFYVIQPLRNLVSSVFEVLPKIFYFFKEKLISKADNSDVNKNGKISEISDYLLGNDGEAIEANIVNQEIYTRILEVLKRKIVRKEYANKDILIISWDNSPENPSFSVKFDTTAYPIEYEKDIEKYFKK